jgi:hypothetical protein
VAVLLNAAAPVSSSSIAEEKTVTTNDPTAAAALRPSPDAVKPAITASEFALKLGTALLMVFAGTLALVHLEIYLSAPQKVADFTNIMF